ncbi:MAG: sugar ABC transporter permease [Chloroflexi bacterium]|nr:sugar ABC transporter permease [Chloroflexota bacterium]
MYLAPALALLIIFVLFPTLRTVYLSLRSSDTTQWASEQCRAGETCWGLLENYRQALTTDQATTALQNTALWLVVMVPGTVILGLLFAVLTDRVRYESLAKSIIFAPMAISFVGASIIWRFVYNPDPDIGSLNALLGVIGIGPQTWLATDPPFNSMLLIVVGMWVWTGFTMTIISAALKGIPTEIIEASRVDGANEWQVFTHVMLPQLVPTLAVVGTTMTINTLKIFDIVWVMKGIKTDVLATRMISELYLFRNNGLSAALAVILIILIIPVMYYNIRQFNIQEAAR